jgi:hypothetical protein
MLRYTESRLPIRAAHCEFVVAAPTNVPRALMAGEYPPTNSTADAPHANPTSLSVSKHIGNGRHDWCDIVPYAPIDTPSGLVDRVALNADVLADRAIQSDWIARIARWVDACGAAGMAMPVVYIAGDLCNAVWTAASDERFTLVSAASSSNSDSSARAADSAHDSDSAPGAHMLGVRVYKTATTETECFVMIDQPHPSWPLVSRGDPIAIASVRLAMRLLKGLLDETRERATMEEARMLAMMDETERLRVERRAVFMARIGIQGERWPTKISHFRDAPYDNDEFDAQLTELLAYGLDPAQLRSVMSRSLFNRPLQRGAREALKLWFEVLGAEKFVTFMCDGVASALASPNFAAFEGRLRYWLEVLGAKGFVTFMCGSVAAALASPDFASFEARLRYWLEVLGAKGFVTFMCDGVASALASPNFAAFEGRLRYWLEVLGAKKFATFMCNSVAAALASPNFASFEARLRYWLEVLGAKKFVTFMCGGVASALASPNFAAFEARLRYWLEVLGAEKFVTFMRGSVAAALASPNFAAFENRLKRLLAVFGASVLATLMCGGVASALASTSADAFEERLNQLRAVAGMTDPDFVTLMTGGVASRILDAAFFSSLVCYERRGSAEDRQMFLKFFGRGVSAIDRLGAVEFWSRVDELCTTSPRPTRAAALARMREAD